MGHESPTAIASRAPGGAFDRAWRALGAHAAEMGSTHLSELFTADPARGETLTVEAAGWYLDYSKQRVSERSLARLADLAEAADLRGQMEAMFSGRRINLTEDRPVLHVALRAPPEATIRVDGQNVVPEVHAVLGRMAAFADQVRSGAWRGHTGRPLRKVLNLGIGGSDLGPAMAYQALRAYSRRDLEVRFVANVDGTDFAEASRDLDPAETLILVASKTFGTLETMTNARTARAWLLASLDDEAALGRHFVALSSNAAAVEAFGIPPANRFGFWDWVGGRFSLWSAVGLSLMLGIGPGHFGELLAGARTMDTHFRATPWLENLPALMGLVAVWNTSFLGAPTQAVLPYDHYLARFPAYLQQLCMESLGKGVRLDGTALDHPTGAIIWGEPGTNGQHSFFQLLHQGRHLVPCDFIGFCQSLNPLDGHHDLLMANLLAQSQALAFGQSAAAARAAGVPEALLPHRSFPGNRPSSILLAERLTPFTLGALIAAYEHSVFTQAALWGLNAFDQWGVELGKRLADRIAPELVAAAAPDPGHDSSTRALIHHYRARRQGPAPAAGPDGTLSERSQ